MVIIFIKLMHDNYRMYFIHNNGDRPYLVYVNDDVYVYESDDIYDYKKSVINNSKLYTKLVKHYTPEKIFIGESPITKMTEFSAGYGPAFTGNTILLHIKEYNYIIISNTIEEFTTNNDEIIKYYSPVGNNDVPYPYAIGEKYLYSWCHPIGYLSLKYFPINTNFSEIHDFSFELAPFFTTFNHVQSSMTIEEFKILQNTLIDEISMEKIKELGNMFHVELDDLETKQQIVNRIKTLRKVDVCKM